MNVYSLLGIKNDSAVIGGIRNQMVTSGIQTVVQGGSGSIDPSFTGVMFADPRIEFETVEIAEALTACGIAGDLPTTLLCAFEANTLGGVRSGTHRTVTPFGALIVPRTLSVSQNSEATISYEIFCYGDATNAPFSVSTSAQTIGQVVSEKFTLGKCTLGGTDFEAQSLNINFGIEVAVHSNSGVPWPLHVSIRNRRPVITITTLDVTKLATVWPGSGAMGLGVSSGIFYLQKIAEGGGTRVAAATAEHIKFTVTEALATVSTIGGSHNAEVAMGITIEPAYDGTNAIIQVNTASAIT